MFAPTYLSASDRERLVDLKARRDYTLDPALRSELSEQIAQIETRRKVLADCTLEESIELRQEITAKLKKLQTQPMASAALNSMIVMLGLVETHYNNMMIVRKHEENQKRAEQMEEKRNGAIRPSGTSPRTGKVSWTTEPRRTDKFDVDIDD